jgi:hypothetical protein
LFQCKGGTEGPALARSGMTWEFAAACKGAAEEIAGKLIWGAALRHDRSLVLVI